MEKGTGRADIENDEVNGHGIGKRGEQKKKEKKGN